MNMFFSTFPVQSFLQKCFKGKMPGRARHDGCLALQTTTQPLPPLHKSAL